MEKETTPPQNIDEYISRFPEEIQGLLQQVRATIKAAAPKATEAISYQMPTFKLQGNLIHFAAFKKHIGLYPTSSGTAAFEKELAAYDVSKGTIRFPYGQPIPFDLIETITRFRVQENLERAAAKALKKKGKKKSAG